MKKSIVFLLLCLFLFGCGEANVSSTHETSNSTSSINDLKASASVISYTMYDSFVRYTDTYLNENIALSGKVIQVLYQKNSTQYLIGIGSDGNGSYQYVVYCFFDGTKTDILEDDVVNVYGFGSGYYTYLTSSNIQNTVPSINTYEIIRFIDDGMPNRSN